MAVGVSPLRELLKEAFPTLTSAYRHDETACWIRRALDPESNLRFRDHFVAVVLGKGHRDVLRLRLKQLHPQIDHEPGHDERVKDFLAEVMALAWSIKNLDPAAELVTIQGAPDIRAANGVWVEVKYKRPTKKERQLWDSFQRTPDGLPFGTGTALPSNIDPGDPTNPYGRLLTRYAADADKKFERVCALTRVLFIQLDLDPIGTILDAQQIWQKGLPFWAAANFAYYDRLIICDNWAWQPPRIDWQPHA